MIEIGKLQVETYDQLLEQQNIITLANELSFHPEVLPGIFEQIRFLHQETPYAPKINLTTRKIADAMGSIDWKKADHITLSPELAMQLLDELSATSTLQDNSKLEGHLSTIVQKTTHGILSKQFEQSNNWKGSLNSLYTLALGAFSEPLKSQRIETWFSLMTGSFNNITIYGNIAHRALFLALSDPSPESEPYLEMGIDITNAKGYLAWILNGKTDFKNSQDYYQYIHHFRTILQNGRSINYPEFTEAIQHAQAYPERFEALWSAINLDGKFTTTISVSPYANPNTYPYPTIINAHYLTERAKSLLTPDIEADILRSTALDFAKTFNDKRSVIGMKSHGFTIFVVLPMEEIAHIAENESELIMYAQRILDGRKIEETVATDLQFQYGPVYLVNENYGFMITKSEALPMSPASIALFRSIPHEVRDRGVLLLSDILALRKTIAYKFTRSVTSSGVIYNLIDSNLSDVFSTVHLWLSEPGVIRASIEVVAPEDWHMQTALPTIECAFTLADGLGVQLDDLTQRLPTDQQWLIQKTVLQLIAHQCCLDHSQLLTIENAMSVESEEKKDISEMAAQIWHIGATKKDGSPGVPSLAALMRHALDVYHLEIPKDSNEEEATQLIHAIGGTTLFELNERHFHTHFEECGKHITWHKPHRSNAIGNPIRILAPKDVFT